MLLGSSPFFKCHQRHIPAENEETLEGVPPGDVAIK